MLARRLYKLKGPDFYDSVQVVIKLEFTAVMIFKQTVCHLSEPPTRHRISLSLSLSPQQWLPSGYIAWLLILRGPHDTTRWGGWWLIGRTTAVDACLMFDGSLAIPGAIASYCPETTLWSLGSIIPFSVTLSSLFLSFAKTSFMEVPDALPACLPAGVMPDF